MCQGQWAAAAASGPEWSGGTRCRRSPCAANRSSAYPVWHNFRGLLRAIDEGNAGLNIPAYHGGLFARDEALEAIQVPDEVCAHFKELGDYDYRPVREVADASEGTAVRSVIDVDILGHIFGQSITGLERLREGLETGDGGRRFLSAERGAAPEADKNVRAPQNREPGVTRRRK